MVVEQSETTSFNQLSARWSRVLGAVTNSTLGPAVELCLEDLGRFTDTDVAFVTLVDDDERVCDDWHWIRPGEQATAPAVGSELRETFASVLEFARIGHVVAVDDIAEIELSPSEQALVAANNLRAVVVVPVVVGSALIGIAGLLVLGQPRTWDKTIVAQMTLLSELLVRAVLRTRDRGALALADARARRISEFVPGGLLTVTTDGVVSWVSPSFDRMTATPSENLTGTPLLDLVHPEDQGAVRAALQRSLDGPATDEVRLHQAGGWRWCDLSLRLASEPDAAVPDEFVVAVHDQHERHLRTDELTRATEEDPLTGVANRAGLSRAFTDLAARGAQLIVAYCDIDSFKAVNDTHGHDAGDKQLQAVARALAAAVRPDDLVARVGGDEFAVAIEPDGSHDAASIGERLLSSVRNLAAAPSFVTVSIGVAGPGPARDATDLLHEADRAMYQAKRQGKDQFVATNRSDSSPRR